MRTIPVILFLQIISVTFCYGQYDLSSFVLSGGTNYSMYLGYGEGDNHFTNITPGFQLEMTYNNEQNFEWIIWGVSHFNADNSVESSNVPVSFWIPYYTEFIFYQRDAKNPLYLLFGYDYVRMRFPYTEKPDKHYNLTFGGGWNLRLFDRVYLQFKVKPYFVIDNSLEQWFGVNSIINLHFGIN